MSKILILPGDGIGKEIVAQALKVIDSLNASDNLGMELVHGLIGGSAYDETGLFRHKHCRQLDREPTPCLNCHLHSVNRSLLMLVQRFLYQCRHPAELIFLT